MRRSEEKFIALQWSFMVTWEVWNEIIETMDVDETPTYADHIARILNIKKYKSIHVIVDYDRSPFADKVIDGFRVQGIVPYATYKLMLIEGIANDLNSKSYFAAKAHVNKNAEAFLKNDDLRANPMIDWEIIKL